jgi:hypothetical protein
MEPIKLDSGRISLAIETDGAVTGEISFNPKDTAFVERFYSAYLKLQEKQSEYESRANEIDELLKKSDGNGVPEDFKKIVDFSHEVCQNIYTIIDEVFGADTSKLVFGESFNFEMIRQFFDGITPYIQKARSEKINRYTNKQTGKVMR